MISASMEDYLLAIYRLAEGAHRPGTGEIARELGVSAASTTAMFKRLAQEELVEYREYGGVSLLPQGRAKALGLIRRHRLAERFLTDMLEIPWHEVHDIADRLEHALPPEVIERFAGLLHHPRTCPHGHPIPNEDGSLPPAYDEAVLAEGTCSMAALEVGQQAVVLWVEERNGDLVRHLGTLGLQPGAQVAVRDHEPFTGMQMVCNGRPVTVSDAVAEAVTVRLGPAGEAQ